MTHRIDHPPVMWHYIKKWVRRRARRSLFIIFKWCWLLTCLNAFFRFSVLKFQRVWRWLTLKDRFVLYTSNMNVYTCIQLQHASQNTDEKMKQEKQNKTHNRRQKYWKTTVRFLTQQNAQSGDYSFNIESSNFSNSLRKKTLKCFISNSYSENFDCYSYCKWENDHDLYH